MLADIERPSEVVYQGIDEARGVFIISPLEPGYGITIGNAYRRVLLSSLYGYAIVSINIPGIKHEFSAVPGVLEDMIDLVLNLKQIRFKAKIDGELADQKISISIKNSEVFKAGDIENFTSVFEIANPEHIICNIAPGYDFSIDILVSRGKGYVPATDLIAKGDEIGNILIDAIYSPIKNVKFDIENTRVENRTDYDKLLIEVTTDKTISPEVALNRASNILLDCFSIVLSGGVVRDREAISNNFVTSDELSKRKVLKKQLKDMTAELSTRSINCLKNADIYTLGELLEKNIEEIKVIKSFGTKSLKEVTDLIEKYSKEV